MKVKEHYPYLKNRLILSLQNYTGITFSLLAMFLSMRILELIIISIRHSGTANLFKYETNGIVYDLIFFFNNSILFFIPIILLSIVLDFRVVNFFYTLINSIILLIYLSLVVYFSETLSPLGADLFLYTEDELKLIIGSSGVINVWFILLLIGFLYLSFRISSLFRKIDWPYTILIVYLFVSIGLLFIRLPETPNSNSFRSEINYHLSSNKLAYFTNSINEKKAQESEISYDGFYFDDDLTGKSFKYIDPENYPFLNIDTTQNVIANYFAPSNTRPNIVIIIVEGLGRSYSGIDAENGSFTPFLDSLSMNGLYWENFLSNGGRTFAVLPAILASAPFGERGILEYVNDAPKHQSLPKILTANGYVSSFYHGGNSDFDYMNTFLKNHSVSRIIDEKTFPKNYKKMPVSTQNFTWGYGDKEMFDYYFKTLENINSPRLDILLTLSNHSPFKVNEMNKYRNKFEKRLEELNTVGEGKEAYNSYRDMYSCVLYSDDAIRTFINNYKKRKDFNNTIFIITGDHRMPEIPIDKRIDHFRVPLIVYSPLINRPARFKGVSSHLDITPTLISYLRINHNIKRPIQQSWLGADLDTSRFFTCKKFIPMMRNKNELQDFVDRSVYFSVNKYSVINDKLTTSELSDIIAQKITEGRIKEFKGKNAKIKPNISLVPDSVYYFSVK